MASKPETTELRPKRHAPASFAVNCQCPASPADDCPLTSDECRLRLELRKAGFSADARDLPRDETALRLLCAFNGLENWRKAPPGWWFHPNDSTKAAWERVAAEARTIFEAEKPGQEIARLGAENDRHRAALERIAQWAEAYPPDAFPRPDADYLRRAAEVLAADGMTLDRLSADAMRHVVEGVGRIAREVLRDGR